MKRFRDLSISNKVIGVMMLATGVALILSSAAFLAYEWFGYRDTAAGELSTMAQIIAASNTAALTFGDRAAAIETLGTLRGEARVQEACIFAANGSIFACYSRDGSSKWLNPRLMADGPHFGSSNLTLFHPVRLGSDRLGTIYLKSDLRDLYARMRNYAGIVLAVLVLSLLAALLTSSQLQYVISRPILDLANTASRVSTERSYSIRAQKQSEDEIGLLVDRFNEMMEQIHTRDLALQSARNDLELRVTERTAQLEIEIVERKAIEQDLIAAKEAAEQSDRAKSAFLANMSHELRTPLNAIIGYSEMIEEEAHNGDVENLVPDVRKIQGAGKHLLVLINEVLDLSKIEAGRLEIHSEPLEVGALVDEVVGMAEPLARKNGNRLEVSCDDPGAMIETDLVRFRQSIFNLISNACKFTENGVVTLDVRRFEEDGRDWFDWRVQDTGIGISPDERHKLFQSFSQIDSSSTRKHGGTGLGLAISKRLCELMGGQILVDSEVGQGSTFTVRLPAKSVATTTNPPATSGKKDG